MLATSRRVRVTNAHLQAGAVEAIGATTAWAARTTVMGNQRHPTEGAETLGDMRDGLL